MLKVNAQLASPRLPPEFRGNVGGLFQRLVSEMQAKRQTEKSIHDDLFWQRMAVEQQNLPTTTIRTNKNNVVCCCVLGINTEYHDVSS